VQENKTTLVGVSTSLAGSSLVTGTQESVCGTVTGALQGSPVDVSAVLGGLQPVGIIELGRAPAANQVCIYRQNVTAGTLTTTSTTYNFAVIQ